MNREDEKARVASELQEAEAVLNMTQMPGWVVLSKTFEQASQVIQDALLEADDINKIRRLQERHRAIKQVTDAVRDFSSIRDMLRGSLADMFEDEQNNPNYN